jgi:tetratricopeptide (TPR) repeat protein
MSTVGIAMIARNGARWMRRALDPFAGIGVDEVSIVLGGISSDKTEAIAHEYTNNVTVYTGALDEDGRLLDFGAARQQSFDALNTDWAIVVDTDDEWNGIERLPELIALADERNATLIMVPYRVGGLEMYQPRLYRRDAGHWEMPIHEYFQLDEGRREGIKTDWLALRQAERSEAVNQARMQQNVNISTAWLAEHGENRHLLSHLAKDLATLKRYDESIETAERYLQLRQKSGDTGHKVELASVLYHKAGMELMTGRLDAALPTILTTLAVHDNDRDAGPAWALLSEIWYAMSGGRKALCELAVVAADQALRQGRARGGFAKDNHMSMSGALSIKASALESLGRLEEARAALDLGLMISPGHAEMQTTLRRISANLNELP